MDQKRDFHALKMIGGLIEALPEAVLVISSDDRVLLFNDPAHGLFPTLRPSDLLARSLRSPDVLDSLGRVRTTNRAERVTWLERVPVERVFEVNVAPLVGADIQPVLVLTLRDLSETRRIERMRADFVANASHELRTPLASLLGFVETLMGPAREDSQARTKFLIIMREQAQRMSRLVDDLLSLSRIEQNLHLRPQEPVDLTAVLSHIVDTLGPLARENQVILKLDAPGPVVVTGDRDELMRVAENLVENAIKYGASYPANLDKSVDISVLAPKGEGLFAVRDHGPGIAPEHLPRLTERFYRVDAGQSRAKGGTGLGLAIVKHIIARHRGRLNIESKLGDGAVFSVTLPLHTS
jgi:two-component system, OmpR family, phosphate regulon sensor histidine kinase PhoR